MRRVPRIAATGLALGLLAAACSDDGPAIIDLDAGGLAPATEDIQTEADGERIDDLTFSTLDGAADGFANHLGRPLVVNFFASWCGPCRAEMPEFQEVFEEVGTEVGFLGISRDDIPGPSLALIDETGVQYPIGWDEQGELFPDLGLFAMPSTLFVNADGVIVEQWGGILSGSDLREMIEENLV